MIRNFIQPLGARVLVRLQAPRTESAGGILLADQAQERPSEGTVVALGPDAESKLELGQHVIFGKFAGKEVVLDEGTEFEQKFWLIHVDEIDAKIVQVEVQDEASGKGTE